jgi:hypothetical protein
MEQALNTPPADHEQTQAPNFEQIKPLVELCKAGRLFEVQEWIRAGKPLNPPPHPGAGNGPARPWRLPLTRGSTA